MSNDKRLSILGHLKELRKRLIRSVIVVAIAAIIAFVFYEQIINVLKYQYQFGPILEIELQTQAIEMTERLGTIMRVAIYGGVILAMPYLTYELVMFVSPALTLREKKYVYLILPWIALMFAGGVAFGYFILVPRIINFLLTYGSDIATLMPRIGDYIKVVTRLLLVAGLVFELPVLTTFLAWIGIITSKWLASKRRIAIIIAFILAGIITPTIDPINQTLVAAPLVVLYEISIWLAWLVQRRKARAVTPVSPTP
jgi:sec-independent protein translocase protein TatC